MVERRNTKYNRALKERERETRELVPVHPVPDRDHDMVDPVSSVHVRCIQSHLVAGITLRALCRQKHRKEDQGVPLGAHCNDNVVYPPLID